MREREAKTRRLVLTAMLFAVAAVLSIIEGMLPAPVPVPGVRFGLSNIAVMYALFFLKKQDAFFIALLKGLLAALTRGAVAGILSTFGGVCSILAMISLKVFFKEKGSLFLYSMWGALSHNLGQFAAISFLYGGIGIWYYLPVLIVAGMAAGMVTALLLKFVLPALEHME